MRLGPLGVLLTITFGCNDQSFKVHEDPPTAAILEPGDGDAFVAGTPVAFRVQLDDNDDGVDALTVAWRSDTLGTLAGESSIDDTIQTFVTTDLVLGTHTVTVTATDPDGQTAEDMVEVVVRENSAPLIAIEHPTPGAEIAEGEDMIISVRTSDSEESASSLRLKWVVDDVPQIDAPEHPNDAGEATFTVTDLDIGDHNIYVTVTDLAGLSSNDLADFSVLENQPPVIAITSPEEGQQISVRDGVSVWISVTDPEEDVESLTLAWTVDGLPQDDAPLNPNVDGTAHLLLPPFAEGEHTIGVSVSDAFGGSHNASVDFLAFQPDADGDGFDDVAYGGDDCDDTNESIHPDADEICDGIDNDCDELIDDEDSEISGGTVGYVDVDGDGFGGGTDAIMRCDDSGLVETGGDCDDDNAAIHPGAIELCNGIDDDCDGDTDETLLVDLYTDADEDGFGGGEPFRGCPDTEDTVRIGGDCDDFDDDVHPDVTEVCNGIDDDCDGEVDETFLVDLYTDADEDGFGGGEPFRGCPDTEGAVRISGDCDDDNRAVNPSVTEVCNGIDDDCDGDTDETFLVDLFVDADEDGFGGGLSFLGCEDTAGTVRIGGDCDDENRDVNPSATEVCNGFDDDCDGDTDETFLVELYTDADDDGFGGGDAFLGCEDTEGTARIGGDCDDENRAVNPSATEVCNGIDDDCDGGVDETFLVDLFIDADEDGFGGGVSFLGCEDTAGTVRIGGDCDDENRAVNPSAAEVCNGIDDDCDGDTDETFLVDLYTDIDDDGYGVGDAFRGCADTAGTARVGGDCNDGNRAVNPGASESCNGIDDDCDGDTDETFLVDLYTDADDDGFGGGVSFRGCADTAGTVRIGGDCNDFNRDVHPDATEICNGIDDDCDSGVDEALLADLYMDVDEDGFGGGTPFFGCIDTAGTVTTSGDCNDTDANVNPGVAETCNGIDDNCDGNTDETFLVELYTDADDDGFGGGASYIGCRGTEGTASIGGDCNDLNKDINPGVTEVCNGIDDDCDDATDEGLVASLYTDSDDDGFGTGPAFSDCVGTEGTATKGGDCDDGNNAVHPDADEICNDIDDNCDGATDEGLRVTVYDDADGDGYGAGASYLGCVGVDDAVLVDGDCNDLDKDINPDAFEFCDDGIDNDCDGSPGICQFSGAHIIDDVADFTAVGAQVDDEIGTSLATADLTGNGHLDLIVGSAHADVEGDDNSGGVYIIEGPLPYGTKDIDDHESVPIQISGYDLDDLTGFAVVGSRVNGDEHPDLLIGSPGVSAPGGGMGSGEVRLFLGPLTADMMGDADFIRTGSADITFNGVGVEGRLGRAIAGGGDIDGDGLPDTVMSADMLHRGSKADCGAVYIFSGGRPDWDDSSIMSADDHDAKIYSDLREMYFGRSLSFVGDTNGDEIDDLLIGAPNAPVDGIKKGAAFLMHGHATKFGSGAELRHTAADAWYGGEAKDDEAGFTVAGLGDVDEDGRTEFAIGAPKNNQNGADAGAVYIMLEPTLYGGKQYVLDESDIQFYGSEEKDRLGLSPVQTADFNNDSITDLILGSPQISCPAASCGKTFVFYGPIDDIESGDLGQDEGSEDASFRGMGIREFAGKALLAGHDMSNDGIDDLVISAPGAAAGEAGFVHVVLGKGF